MVKTIVAIFQIGSVGCGFLAAWFWYITSKLKTPTDFTRIMQSQIAGEIGFEEEVRRLASGVAEQSRLNSQAAKWTAASVLAQLLAMGALSLPSGWVETILAFALLPAQLASYLLPLSFIARLFNRARWRGEISGGDKENNQKNLWGLYLIICGAILVYIDHTDRFMLLQGAWEIICGIAILVLGKSWWASAEKVSVA
jgi:hypothetical protein